MKRIILASASVQRRKLLKLAGIPFTVRPSHAKEIKKIKTTCAALVKDNALLKAGDIAAKVKDGIIIAADTVVYAGGGQLIGKPRSFKDARRILKILSSGPGWVYTGVAVIDARAGKRYVDYEKTKIFMQKLTDSEMDCYHSKTFPLDKAGGFDIEGRGGLFIKRIEGCYSNVIGLPMAKLRIMLKKVGISVLSLFLMISMAGCTTEYNLATGREETLLYGTEKEIGIGDAVASQVEANFEFNHDVDVNERVQRILDRLVKVCDRKELVYTIRIIKEDKLNAVSLPGGYIYVFQGLVDRTDNDDQLAGVIAHEIGHITAKHAMKRLQNSYGYTLLQVLAVSSGNAQVAQGVNTVFTTIFLAHSRADEFQSDKLAVKYTKKAGYDPKGMIEVLRKMREEHQKGPRRRGSYLRTHPYLTERMAMINKEITGRLEFRDYLNITYDEP